MPKKGTLTKAHIINSVIKQNGFTQKKSFETVETILEIIKSTLESGEDVLISGFGKFCEKQKSKRRGRNPATREDMILAPRKVVTFQLGDTEGETELKAEIKQKGYSVKQMVVKLRRVADCLENGKQFQI